MIYHSNKLNINILTCVYVFFDIVLSVSNYIMNKVTLLNGREAILFTQGQEKREIALVDVELLKLLVRSLDRTSFSSIRRNVSTAISATNCIEDLLICLEDQLTLQGDLSVMNEYFKEETTNCL